MNPINLIGKYYDKNSETYYILIEHSKLVAKKAIEIANNLKKISPHIEIDFNFLEEASMLHDIGIFQTNAKGLGCNGKYTYVAHGYLGRELLEKENLPKHALVCERHVGLGLTKEDIINQNLPLPKRDMIPISIEEKIVCLADKFFTKNKKYLMNEKPLEEIKRHAIKFGQENLIKLDKLLKELNYEQK